MSSAVGYILVLVFTNGFSVSALAPNKDPYATYDECKGAGEVSKRQSTKRLDGYLCTPIFAPGRRPDVNPDAAPSP
jgi:hypothetical protein